MQSSLRLLQSGNGIRKMLAASHMRNTLDVTKSGRQPWSRAYQLFSTDAATSSSSSGYAVVDHSEAYETAMQGPHGQQLALARLEGAGKDEAAFDPFLEGELAEAALAAEDYSDDEDDDVIEAEYVNDDDEDDSDDDEEEEDIHSPYNRDGSVRRSKSVLATLRAGFPAGGQFAVIGLGGAHHKVTTDDLIVVNRLKPVGTYRIGSVHTLTDVMLLSSSHKTLVGMPHVKGAEVDLMVEEITRDAKVIIFKKRRRKNSQRKNGFRRDVTLLRVLDIRFPKEEKDHDHVGRDIVNELAERIEIQSKQAA